MTTTTQDVLRPAPGGIKGWVMAFVVQTVLPRLLSLLQWLPWNRRLGVVFATRYDEVREVYLNDRAFRVTYKEKLDVIMGEQPFFLGMDDTEDYRRDTAAMRKVIRIDDIQERLAPAVVRLGREFVDNGEGEIEVVDQLVRRITFDLYQDYFGIPNPPGEDLRVWATRLFEFQFADGGNDPALGEEVNRIAPALRDYIDQLIVKRKKEQDKGEDKDDVLGRCIEMQARSEPGFSDLQIRSSLVGFIVGGPPQPPMVVPQALEQLLRRPEALRGAQLAAQRNDDKLLAGYIFEALRFDPLAPFMPRVATRKTMIAAGTRRAVEVPEGTTVFVAFSSAMMDDRRVSVPKMFDPNRLSHEYIHFGYGHHQCFGIHMNKALLPLMLKPLLQRKNLRRAPGARGKLSKRGVFAERLWVQYDSA